MKLDLDLDYVEMILCWRDYSVREDVRYTGLAVRVGRVPLDVRFNTKRLYVWKFGGLLRLMRVEMPPLGDGPWLVAENSTI